MVFSKHPIHHNLSLPGPLFQPVFVTTHQHVLFLGFPGRLSVRFSFVQRDLPLRLPQTVTWESLCSAQGVHTYLSIFTKNTVLVERFKMHRSTKLRIRKSCYFFFHCIVIRTLNVEIYPLNKWLKCTTQYEASNVRQLREDLNSGRVRLNTGLQGLYDTPVDSRRFQKLTAHSRPLLLSRRSNCALAAAGFPTDRKAIGAQGPCMGAGC